MRQRRVAQPMELGNTKWLVLPMDQPVDFDKPFLVFSNDFTEAQIGAVLAVLEVNTSETISKDVSILTGNIQTYKWPSPVNLSGDTCKNCGGLLAQTGTCKTCTQCGLNEGCG